jgi:hypothetical protein
LICPNFLVDILAEVFKAAIKLKPSRSIPSSFLLLGILNGLIGGWYALERAPQQGGSCGFDRLGVSRTALVAVAGGLSMGVGFGIQGGGVQLHQLERGLRALAQRR